MEHIPPTNDTLVASLVNEQALKTPAIINAFRAVDRKDFVPSEMKAEAYGNYPLAIGAGQTISQPYTVAFMLELLQPQPGHRILDIGSGSGWQSMLLAHIVGAAGHVYGLELLKVLHEQSKENLNRYAPKNLTMLCMNAEHGLSEYAPYDRIIAAAALSAIPRAWKDQLVVGGRIVAPVDDAIVLLVKTTKDTFQETAYPGFAFVPFIPDRNT